MKTKKGKFLVLPAIWSIVSLACTPVLQPLQPTDTHPPTGVTPLQPPATAQSPSPDPAPTALNATGPYLMITDQAGIWIANPDGSFVTRIFTSSRAGYTNLEISPSGDRLALVTQDDQGLDLAIVRLPGGETEIAAHLLDLTVQESYDATSQKAFASYAIRDYDSLNWQPGSGALLAFVAAVDGPTADLYLYDTRSGEATRLTSGLSQTVLPTWSPDGEYILNYGVSWVPPFGGAILGHNRLDSVWSVRVSDGNLVSLPKPVGNGLNFVGWQDDRHYYTYDASEECDAEHLRSVDVASGEGSPVMDASFYAGQIALSPETGALLFAGPTHCPSSPGEGTFMLLPGQDTFLRILETLSYEIRWLDESGVFQAYPEALVSADGLRVYEPPLYQASHSPAISVQGYQAWVVYENQRGRVVVKTPGSDWQDILEGSAALMWDPVEGRTLFILQAEGMLFAASSPDFTPRLVADLEGGAGGLGWIP